ncbi:hypothetical protein JCM8097_002316 [Rhodosporidiobolus ruineniae]
MWPARLLIWTSLSILLHSAYAAWLARMEHKGSEVEVEGALGSQVPLEVLLESLLSFSTLVIGILWSAPSLKGVTWASEMAKRSVDTEDSGMGLLNVKHRGSVLFREGDE